MQVELTTDHIIPTKLHRPPVDKSCVPRPRLLERLNQHSGRPLTIVSAPPGYGKSTLISFWLEACDIPGAWISLDENDSHLSMFTTYFTAAIEALFPGACRNTQVLLSAPDRPLPRVY